MLKYVHTIGVIFLFVAGIFNPFNQAITLLLGSLASLIFFCTSFMDDSLARRLCMIVISIVVTSAITMPNIIQLSVVFAVTMVLSFIVTAFEYQNNVDDNSAYATDLDKIREQHANKLKKFYKKHKPRVELNNKNIRLRLVMNNNLAIFYCINKKINTNIIERFVWRSYTINNSNEGMTLWGFIDMEFNENTSYDNVIQLYNRLRFSRIITHYRKILPIRRNQYRFQIFNTDKPYAICNKYKTKNSKSKKNKTRKYDNDYFTIKSDIGTLYDIYFSLHTEYSKIDEYGQLLNILLRREDCIIEQFKYQSKINEKSNNKNNKDLLDINKAIESELANLPGVNIILAKRIVQRRECINGFKTKEEFYEFCKFKPHFVEQLDNLITFGNFDIIDVIFSEEVLTVDLIENYDDIDGNGSYDDDNDITVDL